MSLDEQRLMDNVEGDREFAGELIETFLASLPEQLGELRKQLTSGSCQGVMETAHSVKGAISNFDLGEAWQAAFAIEKLGRAGNLGEGDALFAALQNHVGVLCGEMRAFLGREN